MSRSSGSKPTEDFEWDANAPAVTTTWQTASAKPRGRRTVYGSRANRGPSRLARGSRRAPSSHSAGTGTVSQQQERHKALVRDEDGIGPLGLGSDDPALSSTSDGGGGGGGSAEPNIGLQRESSLNSAHSAASFMDSSVGTSSTSSLLFDQQQTHQANSGSAAAAAAPSANANSSNTSFPPAPSSGRGSHSRSNSVSSGLQGRPPVAQGLPSLHQRSTSLMSPMGSGNILFGSSSASGRSPSLSALEGVDRENVHPNHSSSRSQGNTPQKVFGSGALSAPSSAAPSPMQGYDDEVSSINSSNANSSSRAIGGRSRRKKTRRDTGASPFDDAATPSRPMSSPLSSGASSTSFSSLSKMGDMAPTWVRRSLQDCVAKNFATTANGTDASADTASAGASPSTGGGGPPQWGLRGKISRTRSSSSSTSSVQSHSSRHRRSSASFGGQASSLSQMDLTDLNPSNSARLGSFGFGSSTNLLSSPTRSTAAGSTASSRKRGVCESPVLDGDDIISSPSGSTGLLSCSSRRSRTRSRIFSPDSTKKLMASAASAMCGIVDEDFFRTVGTGIDVVTGRRSTSTGTGEQRHQPQHRGNGRKRDSSLFRDSEADSDDDEDHSNASMVHDASMESEGFEVQPAGIVMSSRLHNLKNDDDDVGGDDEDPTARLFGASGSDDIDNPPSLGQMSPPPRTYRRSRSNTFAESVFGSVDGSLDMMASPEKKCKMDESPAPSPSPSAAASSPHVNAAKNIGKAADKSSKETKPANAANSKSHDQEEEEENPLKSVSSYEDLKFMIKTLRKWSKGKNLASFGVAMGCTIAIPSKWSPVRKGAFMTWAKTGLGFSLRSGGGNVAFLQTTSAKGMEVLKDLEAKLLRHKELTGHTGVGAGTGASRTLDAVEDAPPLFLVSAPHIAATSRDVPRSVAVPQVDKDIDADLLCNMDSLALNESAAASSSSVRPPKPSAVAHRAAAAAATADKGGDSPLVRTVTLDPRHEMLAEEQEQQNKPSHLPCFAPMSVSPKDASFEAGRPRAPRHSGEYSVDEGGGVDIMQHINGFSPDSDTGGRDGVRGPRPPRLSFPSRQGPRSICRDSLMPPVEESTPAPPSQVKMMSLVKSTPTFDVIETPMPEDGPGFWGSRPIPGKDWGASDKCDAAILAVLLQNHDTIFAESDYCGDSPLPMITSQTPFTQSTLAPSLPYMHAPISETARSSKDLGFDLEADNTKKSPVQLLRPKSRLNLENNDSDDDEEEEDEINGGDDFDADIGMMERRQTTYEARRMTTAAASGRRSRGTYGRNGGGHLSRQGSVGATALSALVLNELGPSPEKLQKRRKMSLAVRKRMSLCAAAFDINQSRRYTSFALSQSSPGAKVKTRRQTVIMSDSLASTAEKAEGEHASFVLNDDKHLSSILSYLTEEELLVSTSLVQRSWAEAATAAHASLMLVSVGCSTSFVDGEGSADADGDNDDDEDETTSNNAEIVLSSSNSTSTESIAKSMERSWHFLNHKFPWATFLSEGAFKRVYRVWNSTVNAEEAVSVMDVTAIEDMGNKEIVGAELSVSVLLSSLVRRNVCPNFVVTRGVFTCPYEPAESHWGCAENKKPQGSAYDPVRMGHGGGGRLPSTPSDEERGKFQYIRMELCRHGDIEEWLKKQPDQSIAPSESRMLLFQMAFALHTAADRYSMKHYDVKLLNFFLQSANNDAIDGAVHPYTVLRYGIGSHVFGLRMPSSRALIAKLADYGTANIRPESNGQPITIGQFTTLENSPPDFLISGDAAKQGFGHDSFGLGLCMLHLFTGHAPYEEILEDVTCPVALKRKLKTIWEYNSSKGYDVIKSVILADVYEDEDGMTEGEPDEILYDTLYRYLVLFGIPDKKSQFKEGARVWRAITSCLLGPAPEQAAAGPARRSTRRNPRGNAAAAVATSTAGPDAAQFEIDCSIYSIANGTDSRIAAARSKLSSMDGGMELLLSLVSFDPRRRATPLDVVNSTFMSPLREEPGVNSYEHNDLFYSYMSYLTQS